MSISNLSKHVEKISGLVLCVIAFTGCSAFDQTILVPEQNGSYHAIALDSSDFGSQKSALRRAEKTCSDWKQHYVVDSQKTEYRGTGTFSGPVSVSNNDSAAQQMAPTKKTAEDYRSIVSFHCIA